MNAQEIRDAIDAGKKVKWANDTYDVIKDNIGKYLIVRQGTGYCIDLAGAGKYAGVLNGAEDQFYIREEAA